MTPQRYQKIRSVLERRQPDLTLITDEVHKGQNLAALRRTCDALGVGNMHAVIPAGTPNKRHAGIAAGTHKWVQLHKHENMTDAANYVRSQGMAIVATSLDPQAIEFQEFDFTRPVAIVMGAEREGISHTTQEMADYQIRIPMLGMVESFNVSVAFALVLMEACRQRRAAGLYDQPRLPESEIERLTFEWSYPKLKHLYQQRHLPYPALDENGQIIQD